MDIIAASDASLVRRESRARGGGGGLYTRSVVMSHVTCFVFPTIEKQIIIFSYLHNAATMDGSVISILTIIVVTLSRTALLYLEYNK